MKKWKILIIIVSVLVLLWSAMLITDTVRSQNFMEPLFAQEIRVEADNDIIVYQGLGYTVKRDFFTNQNDEPFCGCSEVYLFGKLIAAAIT